MKLTLKELPEDPQASVKLSPVKAIVSWLIGATREFRATQSMINDTENNF